VVGHPTLFAPHLGPSPIIVGGHDSGYVSTWPGFPAQLVGDSCDSWAAYYQSIKDSSGLEGSGTSAATPFVAGGAVKILLEARQLLKDHSTGVHGGVVASGKKGLFAKGPLADGKFTVDEWKRVLYVTATRRPTAQPEDGPQCSGAAGNIYSSTPIKWTDMPDQYPEYTTIGYGAVDDPAVALAAKVLAGKADAPDRSDADAFFEKDHQIREQLYEVWSQP
jgi:hypothetical protein